VEVLVKEERRPETISIAVPSLIFLRRLASASVSCLSCFLRRPLWEGHWTLYIVGFRSRQSEPRENRWHRMLEAQKSIGGMV
jgi:hypothetical protein